MSSVETVVVVTGASEGVDAGIVRPFLATGCRVVAGSRKIATIGQPNLVEVAGDISQPEVATLVVQSAKEPFRRVYTLISNAGVFLFETFTGYAKSEFTTPLQVKLGGSFAEGDS